jgi:hypothetical protein
MFIIRLPLDKINMIFTLIIKLLKMNKCDYSECSYLQLETMYSELTES